MEKTNPHGQFDVCTAEGVSERVFSLMYQVFFFYLGWFLFFVNYLTTSRHTHKKDISVSHPFAFLESLASMPLFSFIAICIPSLQLAISYLCLFLCWDNCLILQISSYLSFAIFVDNTPSRYSGMKHDFDFQERAFWILLLAMILFPSSCCFQAAPTP